MCTYISLSLCLEHIIIDPVSGLEKPKIQFQAYHPPSLETLGSLEESSLLSYHKSVRLGGGQRTWVIFLTPKNSTLSIKLQASSSVTCGDPLPTCAGLVSHA